MRSSSRSYAAGVSGSSTLPCATAVLPLVCPVLSAGAPARASEGCTAKCVRRKGIGDGERGMARRGGGGGDRRVASSCAREVPLTPAPPRSFLAERGDVRLRSRFVDSDRTAPDGAPPLPASPPRTAGGRGELRSRCDRWRAAPAVPHPPTPSPPKPREERGRHQPRIEVRRLGSNCA